jgi:hypothetical protein
VLPDLPAMPENTEKSKPTNGATTVGNRNTPLTLKAIRTFDMGRLMSELRGRGIPMPKGRKNETNVRKYLANHLGLL